MATCCSCSSSHSGLGDSSLLSNIQKLFFEKIEVFGNVEFTKLSIVTGVIKIALKVSLLSCEVLLFPLLLGSISLSLYYSTTGSS